MDEVWFRLINHLEYLQVQISVMAQQYQQLLVTWLIQRQQIIQSMWNDEYSQKIKEFALRIIALLQKGWEQTTSNLSFNLSLQQLRNFSHEVSRREIGFLLGGILVGTLIGYNVSLHWHSLPRHLHQMKAIICHRYIGIEGVLLIDDAEMPTIRKSNELLIQVVAASLHDVDTRICSGYSKAYRRLLNVGRYCDLPIILGRDCAGYVVDIGHSVINFDIGDEVCAAVPSWAPGTMAEFIVVPENLVAKKPKLANFEASASLPYSGCLAWDTLINKTMIEEGNARGKRVLVYGGNEPAGCILIQLIKIWGGSVAVTCKQNAVHLMRALGADEVISISDSNLNKELEFLDEYDAIIYTGSIPIQERILKKYLKPYGSYASTVPEYLTSDSLGFISGSIFAGCVRIKLLIQSMFGVNTQHWKEGSKLKSSYLRGLQELVDSDQLQIVVDHVYAPHCIDQALQNIFNSDTVGSTVIKFK